MSASVPVFVDGQPLSVPSGTPAAAAAALVYPELPARLDAGTAYLTDGRGIRLDPEEALGAGAIVRVVRTARRAPPAGA